VRVVCSVCSASTTPDSRDDRERQIGDFFIVPFYGIEVDDQGRQYPVAGGGKTQVYCCDTDRFETFAWKDVWDQAELGEDGVWEKWDKLRVTTEWDFMHAVFTASAFARVRESWTFLCKQIDGVHELRSLPPMSVKQFYTYLTTDDAFTNVIEGYKKSVKHTPGWENDTNGPELGAWMSEYRRVLKEEDSDAKNTHLETLYNYGIDLVTVHIDARDNVTTDIESVNDWANNSENIARTLKDEVTLYFIVIQLVMHANNRTGLGPPVATGFSAAAALGTGGRYEVLAPLLAAGFAETDAREMLHNEIGNLLQREMIETFGKTPDEIEAAAADPQKLCDEYFAPEHAGADAPLDYYVEQAHAALADRKPNAPKAPEAPRATKAHVQLLKGPDGTTDEYKSTAEATRRIRCYDLLCVRPFRNYTMGSGILVKKGNELGNTFRGWADFQLTDNIIAKTHIGHFTFWHASVVTNPKCLFLVSLFAHEHLIFVTDVIDVIDVLDLLDLLDVLDVLDLLDVHHASDLPVVRFSC